MIKLTRNMILLLRILFLKKKKLLSIKLRGVIALTFVVCKFNCFHCSHL